MRTSSPTSGSTPRHSLATTRNSRKFVYLLGAERVVPATGKCHLYDLLSASERVRKELTKEFYILYAGMRENAFEHLCRSNPEIQAPQVLEATQKLLDRILFCPSVKTEDYYQ